MGYIAAQTYFPDTAEQSPSYRSTNMLDLIYLATGGAFLYVCVLYAYACDHL